MSNYVVQICNRETGCRSGFGAYIGYGKILTLHHVVAAATGQDIEQPIDADLFSLLELKDSNNDPIDVTVSRILSTPTQRDTTGAYTNDVALIETKPAVIKNLDAAPLADVNIEKERWGNDGKMFCVEFYGVAANNPAILPILMRGTLSEALNSSQYQFIPQDNSFQPGRGSSGAPVLDLQRNRFIGLMQWTEGMSPIVGYVSPVNYLFQQLKEKEITLPRFKSASINPCFFKTQCFYLEKLYECVNEWRNEINNNNTYEVEYRILPVNSLHDSDDLLRSLPNSYPDYGVNCLSAVEWLEEVSASRRGSVYLLQARGGAGKSNLVFDIVESCAYQYIVPFIIRVREVKKNKTILNLLQSDRKKDRAEGLKEAITDFEKTYEQAFEKDHSPLSLLIIDGLNEYPESADHFLSAAKDLTDSFHWFTVLATERPMPHDISWVKLLTIPPLPQRQICKALTQMAITIPDNNDWLKLLSLPFMLFLDLGLLKDIIEDQGKLAKFIERYFEKIITSVPNINNTGQHLKKILETLSKFAFEQYRIQNLQFTNEVIYKYIDQIQIGSISTDALLNSLKETVLIKLDSSSVITTGESVDHDRQDTIRYELRHQLLHDYLAAKHVADTEFEWTDLGFDAITWDAQDTEPIQMAVELLPVERSVPFILKVYDWNYPAMIDAIERLDMRTTDSGAQAIPHELRDQFAALIAMKLRDPFESTRDHAKKTIPRLNSSLGIKALEIHDSQISNQDFEVALIDLVRDQFKNSKDPNEILWREIYGCRKLPESPDGRLLTEMHSLIGWTATNVYRREALRNNVDAEAKNHSRQFFLCLLPLYQSLLNFPFYQSRELRDNEDILRIALLPRVALRRLVYLMGCSDEVTITKLLLDLAFSHENSSYSKIVGQEHITKIDFLQIVRTDTLRSLLEIAARNPGEIRELVFSALNDQALYDLAKPLRRRLLKSADIHDEFVSGKDDWFVLVEQIKNRILDIQKSDTKDI